MIRSRTWCCRRCGAPLGVIKKKTLVVQQPHASFLVTGTVVAVCRCEERNELRKGAR